MFSITQKKSWNSFFDLWLHVAWLQRHVRLLQMIVWCPFIQQLCFLEHSLSIINLSSTNKFWIPSWSLLSICKNSFSVEFYLNEKFSSKITLLLYCSCYFTSLCLQHTHNLIYLFQSLPLYSRLTDISDTVCAIMNNIKIARNLI